MSIAFANGQLVVMTTLSQVVQVVIDPKAPKIGCAIAVKARIGNEVKLIKGVHASNIVPSLPPNAELFDPVHTSGKGNVKVTNQRAVLKQTAMAGARARAAMREAEEEVAAELAAEKALQTPTPVTATVGTVTVGDFEGPPVIPPGRPKTTE